MQQELADSLKKLSMSEASLEVNTRYRNDLEEEKARLLKDMDRLKGKVMAGNSATLWQHILITSLIPAGLMNMKETLKAETVMRYLLHSLDDRSEQVHCFDIEVNALSLSCSWRKAKTSMCRLRKILTG